MKTFKDLLNEVAEPRGGDEKRFKDKHIISKVDHPSAEEDQFVAKTKKKKREADLEDGEDEEIYESHFKVGDEVECIASGMEGEVIEVDPEEKGKYYTVKREDGKVMKYAPDELRAEDEDEEDEEDEDEDLEEGMTSWRVETPNGVKTVKAASEKDALNKAMAGLAAFAKRDMKTKIAMGKIKAKAIKEEISEEEMTAAQMKKREEIVKSMKDKKADFQDKYGDKWKSVMYATATKMAMKESAELEENKSLIKDYQDMKASGKKDHNILDTLMSMPKYKRMNKDQMAKIIGDAKRKGIFKEEVELTEKLDYKKDSYIDMVVSQVPQKDKKKLEAEMRKYDVKELKSRGADWWIQTGRRLRNEEVELDEAVKMGSMKLKDGTTVKLSKEEAEAVNAMMDGLNSSNKKRAEEEMMKNKAGFDKIVKFAKEAM